MTCEMDRHSFSPRYDLVAPEWTNELASFQRALIPGVPIETAYERLYVCDVCSNCGRIAARPKSDKTP